ncbi:polyribonucleotide nucleotidyltransferase [Aureococcus anophagefferens]|nr:polyribonucleotide nucleotidyltransferase [Aureococcus anophagefferens]
MVEAEGDFVGDDVAVEALTRATADAARAALAEAFADDVRGSVLALREGDMKAHRKKYEALDAKIIAFADERGYGKADARRAAKKLTEKCLGDVVRAEGKRSDGRATDESLATCTLGDNSMNLRNDDALDGGPDKRFYLQYAFRAVVRRRDGPRRRAGPPRGRPRRPRGEALRAAMPDKDAFLTRANR